MSRTEFSLSRRRDKVVPESVTLDDGTTVAIDADFRTVLKCFRVLSDPGLRESQKQYLLVKWFFKNRLVSDAYRIFGEFACSKNTDGEYSDPVMDFEQDSDAIFSSFMQAYGIDLIDVPFLHWYKFKALFAGLGSDTAIGRRIALREMDTSKLPAKERAKAEKAKRSVQLNAYAMTSEEKKLQEALDAKLEAGEDPAEAIRALNDYYDRMGGE